MVPTGQRITETIQVTAYSQPLLRLSPKTPLEVERGTSLTTILKEEPAFVCPGEMDTDVDEPLDVCNLQAVRSLVLPRHLLSRHDLDIAS